MLHINTPLIHSPLFSSRLKKDIYLKMDCFQPSGSFKIRGIGKRCLELKDEGCRHFIIASGGNAGLAVAYAGWKLGIPSTIVLPESSPSFIVEKLKVYQSNVIVKGKNWNESNEYALSLTNEPGTSFVHPFDHPTIWNGNSSLIDEVDQQMNTPPDLVVVAVGGGGYFNGIIEGMLRNQWRHTKVLTLETTGADSLYQSVQENKKISLSSIDSITHSLGAKSVSDKTFEYALQSHVISEVITDHSAIDSCTQFLNDQQVLVEPACGAALSVLYREQKFIQNFQSIMICVCGGSGINMEQLIQYKDQFD